MVRSAADHPFVRVNEGLFKSLYGLVCCVRSSCLSQCWYWIQRSSSTVPNVQQTSVTWRLPFWLEAYGAPCRSGRHFCCCVVSTNCNSIDMSESWLQSWLLWWGQIGAHPGIPKLPTGITCLQLVMAKALIFVYSFVLVSKWNDAAFTFSVCVCVTASNRQGLQKVFRPLLILFYYVIILFIWADEQCFVHGKKQKCFVNSGLVEPSVLQLTKTRQKHHKNMIKISQKHSDAQKHNSQQTTKRFRERVASTYFCNAMFPVTKMQIWLLGVWVVCSLKLDWFNTLPEHLSLTNNKELQKYRQKDTFDMFWKN